MTLQQAFESFLRGIDKFQVASVTPESFLYFFRLAQQDYIDDQHDNYELIGRFSDDMSPLLVLEEKTSFGYLIDKPEDYYRLSQMIIQFSFTNLCNELETVSRTAKRMTSDFESFSLSNPYYKPSLDRWYYTTLSTQFQLYPVFEMSDGVELKKLTIKYIKEPPVYTVDMLQGSENLIWKNAQTDKIVKRAVTLFLEQKKSERIRSQPSISKTI